MALLPVASAPWTTRLRHGAAWGYRSVARDRIWGSRPGKLVKSAARRSSGSWNMDEGMESALSEPITGSRT